MARNSRGRRMTLSGRGISLSAMVIIAILESLGALAQPSPHGRFQHEIGPGKITEECRALRAGEVVNYWFEASGPVDFNVHFHRGDAVEYPVKEDATRKLTASFAAASTDEFCWMWSNRGASPVKLRGELQPTQ